MPVADRRVTIQSRTDTTDETTGIVTTAWATVRVVWVHFRSATVREFNEAGATHAKAFDFYEARDPDFDGMVPSMRVLDGSHTYQVEGLPLRDRPLKHWSMLPVSEVTGG